MYYLQPGQACAVSMICATKSQTSQIMARAVDDRIDYSTTVVDGKNDGTPQLV
jgi:hypothetical protein